MRPAPWRPSARRRPPARRRVWGRITVHRMQRRQHPDRWRLVGAVPQTLPLARRRPCPCSRSRPGRPVRSHGHYIDPWGRPSAGRSLIINGAGVSARSRSSWPGSPGLHVIATASRPAVAWCPRLGTHEVVDHRGDLNAAGWDVRSTVAQFSGCWKCTGRLTELVAPQGTDRPRIVRQPATLAMEALRARRVPELELMFTRARFQTPDMIEHHRLGRVKTTGGRRSPATHAHRHRRGQSGRRYRTSMIVWPPATRSANSCCRAGRAGPTDGPSGAGSLAIAVNHCPGGLAPR